jgi:hypothetical protein
LRTPGRKFVKSVRWLQASSFKPMIALSRRWRRSNNRFVPSDGHWRPSRRPGGLKNLNLILASHHVPVTIQRRLATPSLASMGSVATGSSEPSWGSAPGLINKLFTPNHSFKRLSMCAHIHLQRSILDRRLHRVQLKSRFDIFYLADCWCYDAEILRLSEVPTGIRQKTQRSSS